MSNDFEISFSIVEFEDLFLNELELKILSVNETHNNNIN